MHPDMELVYISPSLRIRWRGVPGQRLNNSFKASAGSTKRRRCICVRIVRTRKRSKIICGSDTPRQNVPVLHRMCIAHMNFSDKTIRIKSYFIIHIYAINAELLLEHLWCVLCIQQYVFYMWNSNTNNSIEGNGYLKWG